MEIFGDTATVYRDFATEAYGSACFREWALGVAGDPDVLAWLQTLPERKRQANLVFAAARWHGVPAPGPYAALRDALLGDEGPIRATILERATQTNEVGRLATLYPAFASLGTRPLALLEVGASAGLCLYPDRYLIRWTFPDGATQETDPVGPLLECATTGELLLGKPFTATTWARRRRSSGTRWTAVRCRSARVACARRAKTGRRTRSRCSPWLPPI